MRIIDNPPGSLEWYKSRMGKITSSNFDKVLTPKQRKMSDQRWAYACRILAERLSHWQGDSLQHLEHIRNGVESEPLALSQLAFTAEITLKPGGFVEADDTRIGASPDAFVAGSKMLPCEVKCPSLPKHLEYLLLPLDPKPGDEPYKCQRQGHLLVCQADEAIFYSWSAMAPPFLERTYRDEPFLSALDAALRQFADEVDELEERAKALGVYQMYEYATPADTELGDGIRRDPLTSEQELARLIESEMKPGEEHRAGA